MSNDQRNKERADRLRSLLGEVCKLGVELKTQGYKVDFGINYHSQLPSEVKIFRVKEEVL
jgi:hypothetical protein